MSSVLVSDTPSRSLESDSIDGSKTPFTDVGSHSKFTTSSGLFGS
jgi:hypothetical protein